MEIFPIQHSRLSPAQVRAVLTILNKGGVVVYPTDTSYGIGCDATNARSVKKIFQIKHRAIDKQVSVIVGSVAIAEQYGTFSPDAHALARVFWPGALTIIVKRKRGKGTIGLRIPQHPIALQLAKAFGRPIVSTSANISGKPPCYSLRAFDHQRREQDTGPHPDAVIDGGALPRRRPSTVINLTTEPPHYLRKGPITLVQLNHVCPIFINKKP